MLCVFLCVFQFHLVLMLYVEDILAALERWSFKETLPADAYKKVSRGLL